MRTNYSILLSLWLSMDPSATNILWNVPGGFDQARHVLKDRGFAIQRWAEESLTVAKSSRVIWVIIAGEESADQNKLMEIDRFVADGGGVFILVPSAAQAENVRSLLQHYGVTLNSQPVPPKNQMLSTPFLNGLRLQSPAARLLDLQENAFEQPVLIPNDLKQLTQNGRDKDRSGLRAVLAKRGSGRIAVVTGAEAFGDGLAPSREGTADFKNNNLEILFRICLWLASR